MYCRGVVTEKRNMRVVHVTDLFHDQPKHEESSHFQIGVSNGSIGVCITNNVVGDVPWPLPPKHNGFDGFSLSYYYTSKAMTGRVRDPNEVWPSHNKVSALCRRTDCVS